MERGRRKAGPSPFTPRRPQAEGAADILQGELPVGLAVNRPPEPLSAAIATGHLPEVLDPGVERFGGRVASAMLGRILPGTIRAEAAIVGSVKS